MRSLIDSLIMYLLKWCFNWLFRQYDIFFDGVELWIRDRLPDLSELPELLDPDCSEE